MKQSNAITGLLLIALTLVLMLGFVLFHNSKNYRKAYSPVDHYIDVKYGHVCTDSTHETCDGECPCDGMECHVYDTKPLKNMQMSITEDSISVFDGKHHIGTIRLNVGSDMIPIDSLIRHYIESGN